MKVTKKMLVLTMKTHIQLYALAYMLGISHSYLIHLIFDSGSFTYEQTKTLIDIFGAEEMSRVIDWEGMNVSCPI